MSPSAEPRHFTSLLARLALVVASLVGVAAVAELVLWLGEEEPTPLASAALDPNLPVFESVLELARPNQRGLYMNVPYRTNSLGIRGPEIARKRPGTFRVIVIGDSVTMRAGVREEHAYPSVLKPLLVASDHSRRVQVFNLGISGLDLRSSLGRLRKIGWKIDPDLVVYGWTINDLEGEGYRNQRRALPFQGLATSRSRFARWLARRLDATVASIYPLPGTYLAELDDNYFHNPEVWHDFETDLERLARSTERHGVCGVVFMHGVLNSLGILHPFDRFYDAVSSAAIDRGLFVVSSIDRLRGRDERELWVSPSDSHPNESGHRIFAESLHDGLRDLPTRCSSRSPTPAGKRAAPRDRVPRESRARRAPD